MPAWLAGCTNSARPHDAQALRVQAPLLPPGAGPDSTRHEADREAQHEAPHVGVRPLLRLARAGRLGEGPPLRRAGCIASPSDNAHVGHEGAGAGRKANADQIAPLCRMHHRELHDNGPASFAFAHMIDLDACARRTDDAWRAHLNRTAA